MARLMFLISIVLVAGCSRMPGKVYPVDAAAVAARVRATEVPMLMFAEVAVTAHVLPAQDSGNRVVWVLERGGSELFRYVATITPERADRTRVAVSIEPGTDKRSAVIFKNLQAEPDIMRVYSVSMTEAVDASIGQRPYNPNPMYIQMMAAAFRRKELILDGAVEQAARERENYRSNIEAAYAAQGKKY